MYVKKSTNAVVTKLRALYGKKLKSDDYDQLVNQYSIAGVINYLKSETRYRSVLESVNETSVHRGQLELLLKMANFQQYIKFTHYRLTDEINIFEYIMMQNELEQMMVAVRLFNNGNMEKYTLDLPVFLLRYTKMDLKKIAAVKTFEDLLNITKGTIYYTPLKMFRSKDGKIDIVRCEAELRKAFYKKILSHIEDKDETTRSILLITIEIFNISVIYRLKKYFGKDKDYIKSCLMPFYLYLNESLINKMVEADGVEELYKVILSTKYKKYFNIDNFSDISFLSNRILYDVLDKGMKFTNSYKYVMICYIHLMEIELKNIITIIECVGYKFSPDEIKKLLIQ